MLRELVWTGYLYQDRYKHTWSETRYATERSAATLTFIPIAVAPPPFTALHRRADAPVPSCKGGRVLCVFSVA
jgi:hypothetical protein